jgi:acyl dehydratase
MTTSSGTYDDGGSMAAPKVWRGRFLEDFEVGDTFRSRLGRTVSEADNTWFTLLTMNTNQIHFNHADAAETEFGQPLESEVLSVRPSGSRPSCGIVGVRTEGVNQRAETVISFERSFLVYREDAPEVLGRGPWAQRDGG